LGPFLGTSPVMNIVMWFEEDENNNARVKFQDLSGLQLGIA